MEKPTEYGSSPSGRTSSARRNASRTNSAPGSVKGGGEEVVMSSQVSRGRSTALLTRSRSPNSKSSFDSSSLNSDLRRRPKNRMSLSHDKIQRSLSFDSGSDEKERTRSVSMKEIHCRDRTKTRHKKKKKRSRNRSTSTFRNKSSKRSRSPSLDSLSSVSLSTDSSNSPRPRKSRRSRSSRRSSRPRRKEYRSSKRERSERRKQSSSYGMKRPSVSNGPPSNVGVITNNDNTNTISSSAVNTFSVLDPTNPNVNPAALSNAMQNAVTNNQPVTMFMGIPTEQGMSLMPCPPMFFMNNTTSMSGVQNMTQFNASRDSQSCISSVPFNNALQSSQNPFFFGNTTLPFQYSSHIPR